MVAELAQEVTTPPVEEAAPVAETPESAAPPEIPETDPLADYLKAEGLADELAPETSPAPVASDPAPEVKAFAEQYAEEKLATERRAREEIGLQAAFRDAAPRTRQFLASNGVPSEVVERVVAYMTGIQGNAAQVYTKQANESYTNAQMQLADKLFPGFSKGEYKNSADLFKAVIDKAREGYVAPTEVEKQVKKARTEEHKRLSENPAVLRSLLSKAQAPKSESGQTTPTGPLTVEAVSSMPIAQIMKLQAEGRL